MGVDDLIRLSRRELYERLASRSVEPDVTLALDAALRGRFTTFTEVITEFSRYASQTLTVAFWVRRDTMRRRPELMAQTILAAYLKGRLPGSWRILLEEASGMGRIDIGVSAGDLSYVLEVKVLRQNSAASTIDKAVQQLGRYLTTHSVNEGFLVLFDASTSRRWNTQETYNVSGKLVRTAVVDIRNLAPSKLSSERKKGASR